MNDHSGPATSGEGVQRPGGSNVRYTKDGSGLCGLLTGFVGETQLAGVVSPWPAGGRFRPMLAQFCRPIHGFPMPISGGYGRAGITPGGGSQTVRPRQLAGPYHFGHHDSQPIPSLSRPSSRCGSGGSTRKLRYGMSPQSRSGGGGGCTRRGKRDRATFA